MSRKVIVARVVLAHMRSGRLYGIRVQVLSQSVSKSAQKNKRRFGHVARVACRAQVPSFRLVVLHRTSCRARAHAFGIRLRHPCPSPCPNRVQICVPDAPMSLLGVGRVQVVSKSCPNRVQILSKSCPNLTSAPYCVVEAPCPSWCAGR